MAIVPMTKIRFYVHRSNRGKMLDLLQDKGVTQVYELENIENTKKENVSGELSLLDRQLGAVKSALGVLTEFDDEKKPLFSTRKPIDKAAYTSMKKEADSVLKIAAKINLLSKGVAEKRANIARLRALITGYEPWINFDLPLDFSGTRQTAALIGTVTTELSFDAFCSEVEQTFENVYISRIAPDSEQMGIFLVCLREQRFEVEDFIRKLGFSKPSFYMPAHTAKQEIANLEKEIMQLEAEISQSHTDLRLLVESKNELQLAYDFLMITKDKYEVRSMLQFTKSSFVLEGYTPTRDAQRLKADFESAFHCYVDIIPLADDEPMPIEFENNKFVTPVEPVTEMFSLPSRDDIDPNPVMSIFYYLFFGLMLSDAGYGLLLVIAAAVMLKKMKPEGTLNKMVQLFLLGGVGSIFWGALFGSWFGNIIPVVAETFFGTTIGQLGLYDPIKDPMPLLILSFIFGILHLFTAMGINFYNLTRHGKLKDAIYDVGFWYLFLIGLILLIPIAPLGTPGVFQTGAVMAIAGALGLILTQGRSNSNFFARIFGGISSLYDVTSYLSDVLSYSRLLALGLATGVIAMVVNTMGSMAGGGVGGAILLIVVFVLGHTMNLLINVLGAFVHTNRLHYVEFFKKFYEGGGKPFSPFHINTKYTKIKED